MYQIGRHVVLPIMAVAILALTLAVAVLGVRSIALLTDKVGPQLEANALVIGERVRDRIEHAVDLGIPFDGMVGVEAYLSDALAGSPGVSRISLMTPDRTVLFSTFAADTADMDGTAAETRRLFELIDQLIPLTSPEQDTLAPSEIELPLQSSGQLFGFALVEIDTLYVAKRLRETTIDIAVMTGIAFLLAAEILIIVTSMTISGPMGQLSRVLERMSQRYFTHEVIPVGTPLNRSTISVANGLIAFANGTAARISGRISVLRAAAVRGARGLPEATLTRWEAQLARIGRFASTPDGGRPLAATQLIGVRGAAFLFVMAEELTRPFLPIFIGTVAEPTANIDRALLIAIPISAFMLGLALAGPIAAIWSDRMGRRTSYVAGAILSTAGLFWTAYATGLGDLMASRAMSGFGYALTFVACQGHVIDRTDARSRTRGMSAFVGGIMAADICGPAIGGILADQIGYRGTLMVAAGFALFAAGLATLLLDNDIRPGRTGPEAARRGLGRLRVDVALACLRNGRLVALIVLAAIPAKMLLTGFLFFLVPLTMLDLGASDAEIGRIAMIYGIAALALMPSLARLCDRFQAHGFMVGFGALVAGWPLVPLVFGDSWALVALAVLGLGVGHSMSIPAQSVLVTLMAKDEIDQFGPGPVLGVFRLSERIGSVIGPLIAARLTQEYGLGHTAAIFGFFVVTTGTVFSALFLSLGTDAEREPLSVSMQGEL
jgi:predicted MFS family arabinose efflux permease